MASEQVFNPGDRIGPYVITEIRAHGGMGVVYRARDPKLQRDVALKVLSPQLTSDPDFTARFQREAVSMAQLSHPNIVQVYDADVAEGVHYLAMEYITGESLYHALQTLRQSDQMMPEEQALGIARQIASALDFAHRKGLVHRDVKPSNVLRASEDRWVLTDFGIVMDQGAARLTRNVMSIGTPEYMSPEQGQGMTVDGRSDVYSLGIVLYEMLSGKPPFTSDSALGTIYKHVQEALPSLTDLRKDLSKVTLRIIERATAKQPAQRFQFASDMVRAIDVALGNAADSQSIWSAAPGPRPRPGTGPQPVAVPGGRPVRAKGNTGNGKILAVIGGGIALIGLVAVGGFILFGGSQPAAPAATKAPVATALPPTVGINVGATSTAIAESALATVEAARQSAAATASAVPTNTPIPPSPTPTPTPPPVLKLDVVNGRATYESWAKPGPGNPCVGDPKNGQTQRFSFSFKATNLTKDDLKGIYIAIFPQGSKASISTCPQSASTGMPALIKAGETSGLISYFTFIDTRTVREVQIGVANSPLPPARACFNDANVVACDQ